MLATDNTAAPAVDIKAMVHRKPSVVVRAAIHGLQTHRNRDDFIIDMHTYGSVGYNPTTGGNLCIGCLATCALQSITNVELTTDNIAGTSSHAEAVSCDFVTVASFETAVNNLRFDDPNLLYSFCGISSYDADRLPASVGIGNWLKQAKQSKHELDRAITELTEFATKLESLGF